MIGIAEMFAELDGYDRYKERLALPPRSVEHGYRAYVTWGCRCETCRAANAAYMRDYKARRAAKDPAFVEVRRRWNRESMQRTRARKRALRVAA